uniref:Uncharacterized protein n=1 Tax=Anguilla anguilla TaxID=7936 RepID=A0A0E9PHL3_ANGAN
MKYLLNYLPLFIYLII